MDECIPESCRKPIHPLDTLLTAPSYIARDHYFLSTQRALYSHYNTHVTYKGFIGISPVFLQLNENKPLNELSNDEWTKAMKKLSLNICRITSTTRRVTKPDIAACICNLATFGSRISVWVWVQYQLGITVL